MTSIVPAPAGERVGLVLGLFLSAPVADARIRVIFRPELPCPGTRLCLSFHPPTQDLYVRAVALLDQRRGPIEEGITVVFFSGIFRERALASRRRQEPLDDLLKVTAPHEWLLVVGLGVMVAALVVFGVVGSIERSLSYDAVLVHPGQRHTVFAPVSGTVVEVLVEAGDTVEPGEAIARVQTTAHQRMESASLLLNELYGGDDQQADSASAELMRLLLSVTNAATRDGRGVGGDVVSMIGGEVMRLDVAPGQSVIADAPVALVRTPASGPQEVLAFTPAHDAARLDAGMDAQVRVADGSRGESVFPARVASLSERPVTPPEWLTALGLNLPENAHMLRVSLLDDGPGPAVADGSHASLRVVLGRSSIAGLLAPGRFE